MRNPAISAFLLDKDRRQRLGSPKDLAQRGNDMSEPVIDRAAMGRLAKALGFILSVDHPTTVALRKASETGTEKDIKAARTLFLRLKSGDRQAALSMLGSE
jgi:Ribonuclease G/E